jgi:glycosyltransferase involved in cell wall biosynthesis
VIRHSVIVPLARGAAHLERQLRALVAVLSALDPAYEIICVDDASGEREHLARLCAHTPSLRTLELPYRAGTSASLSAGIAAADGETIIAIEAGDRYCAQDLPNLVERLARADLVCGRRRAGRLRKTWLATRHLPRRLLMGSDVHDPSCLFWAARREAVVGLPRARGMCRHLATWVAMRGYRVGEIYVDHRSIRHAPTTSDGWAHPGDLLAAWWLSRRWRAQSAAELAAIEERARQTQRHFGGAAAVTTQPKDSLAAPQTPERRWRRSA